MDDVEVWPEHYQSFGVFSAMGTQWRTGMAGMTGLDYSALPVIEERLEIPKEDSPRIFEEIRIMESAALEAARNQAA